MGTEYIAVVVTISFTIVTSVLLGGYLYRVFTGGHIWLDPVLGPIEGLVLRLTVVVPAAEQRSVSFT